MLPKDRITPQQAAAHIGVSTSAIYRWLRNGTLPGIRLGGRYWVSREAVEGVARPARVER